jgi:hypothetical protein
MRYSFRPNSNLACRIEFTPYFYIPVPNESSLLRRSSGLPFCPLR